MSNNISIPGISQNGFNKLIILHSREDYKIDKFEKGKIHLREARLIPKSKSDKPVFASWYTGDLHIPGTQYSPIKTVLKLRME